MLSFQTNDLLLLKLQKKKTRNDIFASISHIDFVAIMRTYSIFLFFQRYSVRVFGFTLIILRSLHIPYMYIIFID